jgi:hypothetical protein
VTKEKPEGLAKVFIDFAQSPASYKLIEQMAFVPLEKK